MAAYTASQVSINNESKAVVINSDENPESVAKGDFLFLSGSDPKEINRTYINNDNQHVIELVALWDQGNKSNQPAIVLPTTVNFRETINALKNANILVNDNYQALHDWKTKTGPITFENLDGTLSMVPSLLDITTQFEQVTSQVSAAIDSAITLTAETSRNTPALSVPFIDGIGIEHGYGTHDKIDVSATQDGSVMVELPSKSADYTASGTRWNFNKSGVFEELAPGEPAITDKGIFLNKEYTNFQPNNTEMHFLSKARMETSKVYTVTPIGVNCTGVRESPETGEHFINLATVAASIGDTYNYSIFYKAGDGAGSRSVMLRSVGANFTARFDVSNEGVLTLRGTSNGVIESYPNGWYRLSFTITSDIDGNVGFRFQLTDEENSIYLGDASISSLIVGAQITKTVQAMPLVLTNESEVTTPETRVSVPVEGNLPMDGSSFTIVFDALVPPEKSVVFYVLNEKFAMWRYSPNGGIVFRIGDDNSALTMKMHTDYEDSLEENRYTLVWDKENKQFKSYFQGVAQWVEDGSNFDWSSSNLNYKNGIAPVLGIGGRLQDTHLNSSIRNFKIFHYAASDNEVKSWGGVK